MCEPANLMLVHGEKHRISEFKSKGEVKKGQRKLLFLKNGIVVRTFGIPCFDPPNGTSISVHTPMVIPALVSTDLEREKRTRMEGRTSKKKNHKKYLFKKKNC